jgi:GT2 family glycosyltransferase
LTLSIIILSHNRPDALEKTLSALTSDPALKGAEIIVADNASNEGTLDRLRVKFRDARFIDLPENKGIAGFNAGVSRAKGDVVLILDDDARPAPGVIDKAVALLASRPDLAAVALHPRHPGNERSEWPFVVSDGTGKLSSACPWSTPTDRFPVMGSGNLVRRDAWSRVGGYEEPFFLYRNDVDLALKLLASGDGVYFDPAWVVWHDSPATAAKSLRWFELATRNWVWLCRRHARGRWKPLGILLGWLHTHRLAGRSPRAHWHTLWGLIDGLWSAPPPLPETCLRDGKAFRSLMRLRIARTGYRAPD